MRNLFTSASVAVGTALLIAGAVVAPANATSIDAPEAVVASESPAPATDDTSAPVDEQLEPGRAVSGTSSTSAAAIVDGGLQRVRLYSGSLSWSVDGLGINAGSSGSLQVEKPLGATVKAAFLMTAATGGHVMPTELTLGGLPVTFSIEAAGSTGFSNFFGDVTTIVKPVVDAGTGVINITVDEGALAGQIQGTSLVVVFNDPAVDLASVAIYFGTSNPAGDNFTMEFLALSAPQTEDLRMSVGSSNSYGPSQNSRVLVNGEILSEYAGHFDDCSAFVPGDENSANWTCGGAALLTVGGVGDSLSNPTMGVGGAWSTIADDELYSLSPFVNVGDTEINVVTSNASADDNIFMTVFYLDKVEVFETGRLAETGPAQTSWLIGAGAAFLLFGMVLAAVTRRRAQHSA